MAPQHEPMAGGDANGPVSKDTHSQESTSSTTLQSEASTATIAAIALADKSHEVSGTSSADPGVKSPPPTAETIPVKVDPVVVAVADTTTASSSRTISGRISMIASAVGNRIDSRRGSGGVPVVVPSVGGIATDLGQPTTSPDDDSNKVVRGGSMRRLSGLRPVVPLRKRGESFRQTRKVSTILDDSGRQHLNQ